MPVPEPDLPSVNRRFGRLFEALHTPEFTQALEAALQAVVPHHNCVILRFSGTAHPSLLYDNVAPEEHAFQVGRYVSRAYLLDPFFQAYAGGKTGAWRLGELAPDEFHESEYYRRFYRRTAMVDELGMLIAIGAGQCVHISMDRKEPANFSDAEVRRLREYEPLIAGAIRAQWKESSALPRMPLDERLNAMFASFGRPHLTDREAEIVRLLLRGYSAKATSGLLGISTGTVMNHRRSIYAKLNVRSQAELFNLFLEALSSHDADGGAAAASARPPRNTTAGLS